MSIYTINLGQDVYGGRIDVVDGEAVMTVDRVGVDLGTLTFAKGAGGANRFVANLPTAPMTPSVATQQAEIISDIYKTVTSKTIYDGTGNYQIAIHTNSAIWIRNTDYSDATAFKTAMSGHYIVYELAEPITVNLGSLAVPSLLGQNNIWQDAGNIDILKPMDRQLYYGR